MRVIDFRFPPIPNRQTHSFCPLNFTHNFISLFKTQQEMVTSKPLLCLSSRLCSVLRWCQIEQNRSVNDLSEQKICRPMSVQLVSLSRSELLLECKRLC